MTSNDQNSWINKYTVVSITVIFIVTHLFLSNFGLVPTEVSEFNQQVKKQYSELIDIHRLSYKRPPRPILPNASVSEKDQEEVVGINPKRIQIDSVGIDVSISTPDKATVPILDSALQEGVVHYPGSGGIGGERRMFLFGHSSRLPLVQNQSYQAFNGLADVQEGDEILIVGENNAETIYVVTSIEIADESERLVSLESGEGRLTISTCTTFGARENRVVVEAKVKSLN
jgi:LPXTG-site transpeptidase (sortase) family protein